MPNLKFVEIGIHRKHVEIAV